MSNPHIERVKVEEYELSDKITKLNAFIHGPVFPQLSRNERRLLTQQYYAMQVYRETLMMRIEAAEQ